jgi:hypothetical protein
MADANAGYLRLLAERALAFEVARSSADLQTMLGRDNDEDDPALTKQATIAATGCEPQVDVLIHYWPKEDGSVTIQAVARTQHGGRAVWVEATVGP